MVDILSKMKLFNNKVIKIFNLNILNILEEASISKPQKEIDFEHEILFYKVEIKKDLFIKILFNLSDINDLYHTTLEFIDKNYGFDKYSINIHECVYKDIVKCALELHETILNILNKNVSS